MKIQILGGHGGPSKGFLTTSFLIDEYLLIDAGAVTSALSIEEQKKIQHILISHCHLDHIKDLAFLCDNCFGQRQIPFEVYTHNTVKEMIQRHLLNDVIWPDFTKIPSISLPTLKIIPMGEETIRLGEFSITSVKVNHPYDAMGFIVEKENSSVLFTLDTGPTEKIWEVAKKFTNLKAIFTEVSFPNHLAQVARASFHHTSRTLVEEIPKMPPNVPIILTHLKPHFRSLILEEVKALHQPRLQVLERDGEVFCF